ncbi:MAG: cation:proton antiporter [Raineya sp.]|jgi:Kef-type K+ transport system membrane component KefB|nr:cation:proton antiporter [Raineya sp.]
MESLNHHEVVLFLVQLSLMLLSGRIIGEIMRFFNQPMVIGEILAGIILGPTLLGNYFPDFFATLFPKTGHSPVALNGFTQVSVVLLLFIGGLEVELPTVINQGKKAFVTSFFGIAMSFSIGFFITYENASFFHIAPEKHLVFSLFIGTALSITALPVIVRTLLDLGIFKSQIGMLIVATAMIDDFLGWMIFSIILTMMEEGAEQSIIYTVSFTIIFALLMLTVFRRLMDKVLPWFTEHLAFPGGILSIMLVLSFLGAAFTEYIGIHAVFGSFLVGVALGDSVHMTEKIKEIVHHFVTNIFAPLFFVSIGLKVNFATNFDIILVSSIMIMAFAGKTIGCSLAAFLTGFTKRQSLAIGFGMNARGAMEIILATLALQNGLINEKMFVALVVMAIVTSVTAGSMMKFFLQLNPKKTQGIPHESHT